MYYSLGILTSTEGTFPFFSPEMVQEGHSKVPFSAYMADTWAAVVCLWVFVFGALPFYDKDVIEMFRLIR